VKHIVSWIRATLFNPKQRRAVNEVRIIIELHGLGEVSDFTDLTQFLIKLPTKWRKLMSTIEDVKAALVAEEDKIQAVAAYLGDLSVKLDAMKDAPTTEQVQEVLDMVNTHQSELIAMVPAAQGGGDQEAPPEAPVEGQ
jgi:hypothetical protein